MQQLDERLIRAEAGTPAPIQNPLFASRLGPFTARILQTVRPAYAKRPKIAEYSGLTDPFVHMDTFKKVTNNKGFDDATLYHLFSETLDSEAMSWFFECPPGSINSFAALSNAFLSRFILLATGYHNTSQLFSVKQATEETLQVFVKRWRATASRCPDLDKMMALAVFKQGLLKGPFLYHTAEYITYGKSLPPPQTLAKTIQPSSSQQETANKSFATPSNDKKREWQQGNYQDKPHKDQQYHNKGNRSFQGDNHNKQATSSQRYAMLTVLIVSYVEICDQCKDQIPPPPSRKYPRVGKRNNTGKWCKYHEDSGHNTNSCNALKTTIETLYQDGKMEQFKVCQPAPVAANIEPMHLINTIDGGAPITNMSHRARKCYARSNDRKEVCNIRYERSVKLPKSGWVPITFSEEDERGVHLPHYDPFLIDAILDK
ncbi:uncharacterized protein LOC112204018 [Rosa chinensis]|uniref:uncharacterized protein LOC112204018 n=1 Tax=Rosa chinensis TaxID=74649 RepID=UPI000D08A8F6|nr:uncharacterized protein LOC112204018 [Rosa chinensis]